MPQVEAVKDAGYEILYLTEDVDEFAIKVLASHNDKEFKSVSSSDLGIESESDTKAENDTTEENKELFDFLKKSLEGKVSDVKASARLKSHPVCISSSGDLSLEMEKVLNSMPTDQRVKAERVLEINITHPIFDKLKALYASNKDAVAKYANVLYSSALLIEGMSIEDPVSFTNDLCDIL